MSDLLTQNSLDMLRHRNPDTWLSEPVCDFCIYGLQYGLDRGWWGNAEEYIAALGSGDTTHAYNLDSELKHTSLGENAYQALREPNELESTWRSHEEVLMNRCWLASTRLVAAQCIDFLERSALDPEGWLSYDRWVQTIPPDDTIVSFNYDEVIETAFSRNGKPLRVLDPRGTAEVSTGKSQPSLLKLHGGVSFRTGAVELSSGNSIASLKECPPVIAVPGRGKSTQCEAHFDSLWRQASTALERCQEIAMLGYSCPTTDEMAKAMLIDSIAANTKSPKIDIVLGNDTAASARLAKLFGQFAEVSITGLFAQDYLSRFGHGTGWAIRHITS